MDGPLVSIIIPARNEAANIERCLGALRRQTYPKIEIVVIDNCSTDNTALLAQGLAHKVVDERRKGIVHAKNAGIKASSGDLVATIDADCLAREDWIKELLPCFEDAGVAGAGGPNIAHENSGAIQGYIDALMLLLCKWIGSRYVTQDTLRRDVTHIPGCNAIYRRTVLDKLGGFDPRLLTVEDEELDYRILAAGHRIIYVPSAVVFHRRRGDCLSFARQIYRYAIGRMQFIRLHRLYLKQFPRILPSILLMSAALLVIAGFFVPGLSRPLEFLAFSCTASLAAASLYLCFTSRKANPFIFMLLFAVAFFAWGSGMIRGLAYPYEES